MNAEEAIRACMRTVRGRVPRPAERVFERSRPWRATLADRQGRPRWPWHPRAPVFARACSVGMPCPQPERLAFNSRGQSESSSAAPGKSTLKASVRTLKGCNWCATRNQFNRATRALRVCLKSRIKSSSASCKALVVEDPPWRASLVPVSKAVRPLGARTLRVARRRSPWRPSKPLEGVLLTDSGFSAPWAVAAKNVARPSGGEVDRESFDGPRRVACSPSLAAPLAKSLPPAGGKTDESLMPRDIPRRAAHTLWILRPLGGRCGDRRPSRQGRALEDDRPASPRTARPGHSVSADLESRIVPGFGPSCMPTACRGDTIG